MFYVYVGKDEFHAVEERLQSWGFEWINGDSSFDPFNHTDLEKIWIQAWEEDMTISWSPPEPSYALPYEREVPLEELLEGCTKGVRYIKVTGEAWDPVISKLLEEGYTGFEGGFKPRAAASTNEIYLTIYPNKRLGWLKSLVFLEQQDYTETTLDKLLGKLWYIEVGANEIQEAREYLEKVGAEVKSIKKGFLAVREYYVGDSVDKTVLTDHTLREDLLIKRGFEKREWKEMVELVEPVERVERVELEAFNYIKDNGLSVTIGFEYCEGQLDLVEITTDSNTYHLYEDFGRTTQVLEAIQLLETL